MNKVKLGVTFVVMVGVIVGALYWIANNASRSKSDKLNQINESYGYSKGIIVQKQSYKGHAIEVEYQIGNKVYKYHGGWDNNPHHLGEGDSISFRYTLDAPELIVTELDNGYSP